MQAPTIQSSPQRFFHMPKFQTNYQKPVAYYNNHPYRQAQQIQAIEFDGKRLRKAVARKTVDYNSSVVKYIENRVWQRDHRDRRAIQPDNGYYTELVPPLSMCDNPINAVTTKFVRTSTNKMRCPIFCVAWTPEGRRLVTGASSGEFTLWNGLTFNFETILQAHDSPVRCMVWSHSDIWMVTGDHSGYVKYWQSNMNNVKMFEAHKEPLRGISFCPTDTKFTTCSDDGTVRIWDFLRCHEEKILRGHGADVKCVDWHPQKALIVSGSKDSQQPIKLWDPKSGHSLATIHAHKSTVMEVKWNQNGNWLLTASRDHLLKLFDIRNMSQEVQTFRGHKKEACSLGWHPVHENLFASGGSDGSIMFWVVGADKEVGGMEQAHDSCVWSLAWHPLGHILCSGSNDHTSKFWTRNRPGDKMRDKYNLNTLPKGQDESAEYDESGSLPAIPGMGLEHGLPEHLNQIEPEKDDTQIIPGLDLGSEEIMLPDRSQVQRKIPFAKPIPRQFQQQWMENKQPLLLKPPTVTVDKSSDMEIDTKIMHPPPPMEPPPLGPPPPISYDQPIPDPHMILRNPRFPDDQMMPPGPPVIPANYYGEGEESSVQRPRVALLGDRPSTHFPPGDMPPPPPPQLPPPPPIGQSHYLPPPGMHDHRSNNLSSQKSEHSEMGDRQISRSPVRNKSYYDGPSGEWRSYKEPDQYNINRNDNERNDLQSSWLNEEDNRSSKQSENDYYQEYDDYKNRFNSHGAQRGNPRGRSRSHRFSPLRKEDNNMRYGSQMDSDIRSMKTTDHNDISSESDNAQLFGQPSKWNEDSGNNSPFSLNVNDMPKLDQMPPPVRGRGSPGFHQGYPRMRGRGMRARSGFRGSRGGRGMRGGYAE